MAPTNAKMRQETTLRARKRQRATKSANERQPSCPSSLLCFAVVHLAETELLRLAQLFEGQNR
jgi:hypothetical protein